MTFFLKNGKASQKFYGDPAKMTLKKCIPQAVAPGFTTLSFPKKV